jgi:hypothetical protein
VLAASRLPFAGALFGEICAGAIVECDAEAGRLRGGFEQTFSIAFRGTPP